MKLVTNRYKSGGLHEEHAVATWNLGSHRIFSARIILSSVASLALPIFPQYLTNGTIFGNKFLNLKSVS